MWLWCVAASLAAAAAVTAAAGVSWLRTSHGVPSWITRKIFHVFIFTTAAVMHLALGFPGVVLFGTVVSLLAVYALKRGPSSGFYEALSRPGDARERNLLIVLPAVLSVLGGIVSTLLFYDFAPVGYLVCGWGDAAGEVIGRKFGNHKYLLPFRYSTVKSWEGTAGVAAVGAVAAFATLALEGAGLPTALMIAPLIGIAAAAVEAVSFRGTDNFAIQVVAAGIAFFYLV